MNLDIVSAQFKSCSICAYEAVTDAVACPECGEVMQSETFTRLTGGFLLFAGLLLILLMGAVAKWFYESAAQRTGSGFGPGAPETANQFTLIYGLFALVIAFGLGSLIAGIYQLSTGRRPARLIELILLLAGVMFAVGALVRAFA